MEYIKNYIVEKIIFKKEKIISNKLDRGQRNKLLQLPIIENLFKQESFSINFWMVCYTMFFTK